MSAKIWSKPSLGTCFYPEHWPEEQWASDAKAMIELGLTFVRIGEFAWSRMEPRPGEYQWDWLDRAIQILGSAGLKIILCTPTATPPRWMIDKHPNMLAFTDDGQPRKFGSRRHYCFSHLGYREECARIADVMAQRYGNNPHIIAWQIDNEYGCHDTTLSYSDNARRAFRNWLEQKYESIAELNQRWGNVFWSMEYGSFDEIELPNQTVTEPNPSHAMDFRRFASDEVCAFNRMQCAAIRAHCDKPLIHNYMGRVTEFDHFELGGDLEISSWDSYPLGFLEDRSDRNEDFKHRYQRQGDPDFQAFHHDLYRAVGTQGWGIMEQQPGPVNWAPYNPAPLPGMVRLWTWEAFAHGADFVAYFRWRQAPFAQEHMHAGQNKADGTPAHITPEIDGLAQELEILTDTKTDPAPVALMFDYPSDWAWNVQPHGRDFNYFRLVFDFYSALRTLGQNVDIVSGRESDFDDYKALIIPGLFSLSDELAAKINRSKAKVLLGPRSGSKTADFQSDLSPLDAFFGDRIKFDYVESLRPTEKIGLGNKGHFQIWREVLKTDLEIDIATDDGVPALISSDKTSYLTGWPDDPAMRTILSNFLEACDLPIEDLPDGLRVRQHGHHKIYVNYANGSQNHNGFELPPGGVRVLDARNDTVLIEK